VPPPRVVRNYGVFRPDTTVNTGKAMADALGETTEEKALIRKIYGATKEAYEKEAAAKGWQNNIAAGLTFFTVVAMTVYRDAAEPSDDAVNNYFQVVNSALDEMPEFATVANKDKQNFNNMLIGFSGMLLAGYTEGKQNNDAATLATYKKLSGMLIQMVLKTDPDNLRIENGQIVMK
jgi:ADP-ribosylglycohydrolase